MKKHLLASTALIAGSLLAVSAQAGTAEFYGQVNKSLMWVDNGDAASDNDRLRVVDNDLSSTRFGFRGEQEIGNGLTASFLLEGEFVNTNDNSRAMDGDEDDTASDGAASFSERHARVGLSGNFGSAFLGRTSSATDGITEIDLGSVSDLMSSDMAAFGGGVNTFGDEYDNFEGFAAGNADRVNLVRYDTPIYNGFQGSVAFANGGDFDAAVRYGAKFGGVEVKAGVGYAKLNSATQDADQWSGSVSAKHDSGLNATVAYGEQDAEGSSLDPNFWYAKVGYDMGNWGFAVDYGTSDELVTADEGADAWGVGAQYNFGNGVSAGLMYRDIDVDASAEDGKLAVANMRVKF